MKVIDLLQKIANGEDLPEKIRYEEIIWNLNPLNGTYDNGERCFFEDYIDRKYVITDVLNDEVEIIEDKKIERLNFTGNGYVDYTNVIPKINEIIDYINKENKK